MSISAASVRLALLAWLLLTNLSLGLHHRHEAPVGPHRAAPEAWHYHMLLLGVELDFLSLNSESCPFKPIGAGEQETHLLLSSLLDPGTEHEPGPDGALQLGDLLAVALTMPAVVAPMDAARLARPTCFDEPSGLPPSAAVLRARSGVQQI